jgi:hypothetical protein
MNNIFVGILTLFIVLAILCLQAIIERTPPMYVFGAVIAIFALGFIFGENQDHE